MKIKTHLIRNKMIDRKMNMVQAAEEAGVSYSTFQAIMKRGTCHNGENLGKLARFAGVKAHEMVSTS